MEQKEDAELNKPAKTYFERKLKCDFSRVGFTFSAGRLDVLAYDRKNKCFHVCEGKRASRIVAIGHAIGQLVAYISMIQEDGYDFLNRVSKGERLELTDFSNFLERKAIKVCFYIILPKHKKTKLLTPAKLMLSNIGDFGDSIGILFASKNLCDLEISAKPLDIKIRHTYNRDQFLKEVVEKFLESSESKGIVENQTIYPNVVQFKEKDGNPYLHYEVWLKKKRKKDTSYSIEVAFHLEFAKAHLKDNTTIKRKKKIQTALSKSSKELRKKGFDFKYQSKWGKRWSRLYKTYKTNQDVLDDETLSNTINLLNKLVATSKPQLDKIQWGRLRKKKD